MNRTVDPQELLAALDPEQREVALQVSGPLAVLAGAGTGKTRAITYRLAYGAATGAIDPSTVLAVTFTSRAATQMRARLRTLGVTKATALTFHAAALAQLKYFWPYVVGGYVPPIFEHKGPLIVAACTRLGLDVDPAAVRDIAAEIEWAKVSMFDAENYSRAVAAAVRQPPADLDTATMANLLTVYEDVKDERGVIDFEDVLLLMVGMLHEREDVARTVRSRYRNFVVDEFQDVSALQFELLKLWLGDRHDICVVGDVAQTIYSFAGADPHYLVNFAHYHPGARTIQLNRDYRSTPQIVSLANRILATPTQSLGQPRSADGVVYLKSQRESGPVVQFTTYADDYAEAVAIARKIEQLQAGGVALQDMAILYRTNSQSEVFEQVLTDRNIGFILRGDTQFFERDEIRRAVVILGQVARTSGADHPVSAEALVDAVKTVVSELGWSPTPPQSVGAVRERWDNLDALVNLAYERQTLTLTEFVDELRERAETQLAPAVDGVTLSSLHAAKGLEWEAVFLVGLSDGLIPISLAQDRASMEEEKRLLYVGVTRAKTHLHLSYAKFRGAGRSRARAVSRFLAPVWPDQEVKAKPQPSPQTVEESPDHDTIELFHRLSEWRSQTATELSYSDYQVMTDRVLHAIADVKPRTLIQLGTVPGVGETKLERYGAQVLAVIRQATGRA
ncbi:MAG: ATP-dependent DNA helicase UvrD2 [Actinomycetaceae bacterium]|nr:ATP-dependent DNA helicase UvrD2 [Actinomycetaceae bacterium]